MASTSSPARLRVAGLLVLAIGASEVWHGHLASAGEPERRQARLDLEIAKSAKGCGDASTLQDGVASRLGYLPFTGDAALAFRVNIQTRGAALEGAIEVSESGKVVKRRVLKSPSGDCRELTDALAVAISIVIDPLSIGRPVVPPSASSSATAPSAPPSSSAPVVVEPLPPATSATAVAPPAPTQVLVAPVQTPEHTQIRVGLRGQAALGLLPSTSFGGALVVGARRSRWSVGVGGRFDTSISTANGAGAVSVRGSLIAGEATICGHGSPWFLCGLGVLGSLRATGEGVGGLAAKSSIFAGAGARAGFEIPLIRQLSFESHLDVLGALTPVEVVVAGERVWRSAPVSGALGIGLLGILP